MSFTLLIYLSIRQREENIDLEPSFIRVNMSRAPMIILSWESFNVSNHRAGLLVVTASLNYNLALCLSNLSTVAV